jgi:hypothetical protein
MPFAAFWTRNKFRAGVTVSEKLRAFFGGMFNLYPAWENATKDGGMRCAFPPLY